jgi:hypothetical protein
MRETRHSGDMLRFVTDDGSGLVEARIAPHFSAVIFHRGDCDGEHCDADCDAEMLPGADVIAAWQLEGDEAVWRELERSINGDS